MRGYFSDRLVCIGLGILMVGSAPLLGIIFLADVGVWPDPNPNPIDPGLLFFFSFWLGVITLALVFGGSMVRRHSTGNH